jgi:hypothetical protein
MAGLHATKLSDMSSGEAVVSRYLGSGKQIGGQWGRLQNHLGRLQYHLGGAAHISEIREVKRRTPEMACREMQISSREAVVMRGGDFTTDALGVSHIISEWGVVETTCTRDISGEAAAN